MVKNYNNHLEPQLYVRAVSLSASKYLDSVASMNAKSAQIYGFALDNFSDFAKKEYNLQLDQLLVAMKEGSINQYDALSAFVVYLQEHFELVTTTLRQRVKIAKIFLEFSDVEISNTKFRLRVKLPRAIRRVKAALDKNDIREIVNLCPDIRLKTYVLFLASTGMRATEALSVRNKDIDWEADPAKVYIRGEFTKTGQDRFMFLTSEMVQQLKAWYEYKYRDRRTVHADARGRVKSTLINPVQKPEDLVFAVYHKDFLPVLRMMYFQFQYNFAKILDRSGKGEKEDNGKRRRITFHSFRRFAKTTISDLGYSDYSEWFIGHAGSTYWRKKDSDKAEIFKKIEPYLTFLDLSFLEAKRADIESKLEEKDSQISTQRKEIGELRDSVAGLSDQLISVIEEVKKMRSPQQ
jgi:integrase